MKIVDLLKKKTIGSYSAVLFSTSTINAIKEYIKQNHIPNPVKPSKLHTTVLFSRKFLPNYKPAGDLKMSMIGKFKKFEIWPNASSKEVKTNCLVLTYSCPDLVERHRFLMKEHGATYDYPVYQPHLTLSYDVGDLNISQLPNFENEIEITSEYGEDLDLDWTGD